MQRKQGRPTRRAGGRGGAALRVAGIATVVLCAVAASGCAPPHNQALEDARLAYMDARSDPTVVKYAPEPLQEAGVTLDHAEAKYRAGDQAETSHLAYVSRQEVAKARAVASEKQAQSESQRLAATRADLADAARAKEADAAVAALAALNARETEQGLELTVSDVLFQFDKAELKPSALPDLARVATFLQDHPDRNVVIEGYTDSVGTASYNLDLSRRRAMAVRSFLVAQGIAPSRLLAQGFGEGYPVASNATEAGREQNRRVEMLVLNPGRVVSLSTTPIIVH